MRLHRSARSERESGTRKRRVGPAFGLATFVGSAVAAAGSLGFFVNAPGQYDYGVATALPPGFGADEFTFELWIRPDSDFPVGACSGAGQLTNWCDGDLEPYSSGEWWYEGNFLLDGHNNASFADGTFSLQFYGGGRVRWLFGDGASPGPGGVRAVGAFPATSAPSLLTGSWHHLTVVRRFVATSDAALELWIDGLLVAGETSPVRADMTTWWSSWRGFPSDQEGWFVGAEKQAAIGVLSQYEDFKGRIDEMRFWTRAKGASEIATTWSAAVTGIETGLVGWFRFEEGSGSSTCDSLAPARCFAVPLLQPGAWSGDDFPADLLFADAFELGNSTAWSGVVP